MFFSVILKDSLGTSLNNPTQGAIFVYDIPKSSFVNEYLEFHPDSKVYGAPGGPHVGPTNFAVWVYVSPKFVPED